MCFFGKIRLYTQHDVVCRPYPKKFDRNRICLAKRYKKKIKKKIVGYPELFVPTLGPGFFGPTIFLNSRPNTLESHHWFVSGLELWSDVVTVVWRLRKRVIDDDFVFNLFSFSNIISNTVPTVKTMLWNYKNII